MVPNHKSGLCYKLILNSSIDESKILDSIISELVKQIQSEQFIMKFLQELTMFSNPKDWSRIGRFERIWENKKPNCKGELFINPDKRDSVNQVSRWYSETGCNICGQKTPSAPNIKDEFQEKIHAIVKQKGTAYKGNDPSTVGNILYLCPNHARLLEKKCIRFNVNIDGVMTQIHEDTPKEVLEKISSDLSLDEVEISVWEAR